MVALLNDKEQFDLLRNDPSLLPNAAEEGLRWEGSSVGMPKLTTQATTLNGVEIPAGVYVYETHGYANRDAARWENPHKLDIRRERKPHQAFAVGPHSCIGNQLARTEIQTGIGLLLEHFPNMRLDPDFPPPKITGWNLRSASSIHVLLD
jgi:cytochrome P450